MNLNPEDQEFQKTDEAPAVESSAAPHDSNPNSDKRIPGDEPPAKGHLSARCEGLHAKHTQLRRMFEGTGKRSGKLLSGPAEYDRSYAAQLVNYGVLDVDEVSAAVMARPDGHALLKGFAYARSVAKEAGTSAETAAAELLATEQERGEEARRQTDIVVNAVRVIASDASRFELHVEGKVLVLTAKQLSSQSEFRQAFINVVHRMPALPPMKKKKTRPWDDLVNSWLRDAEKQTLIGNATEEEVLKRAVGKAKNAIPDGKQHSLHDDMAFTENGTRYFTADAIFDRVKHLDRNFRHRDVARFLKELGCEFHPGFMAGQRTLDVWGEVLPTPPSSGGTAPVGTTDSATEPEPTVVPAAGNLGEVDL